MATITRKIKLLATEATKEDRTKTYKYIQKIAEDLTVLANEATRKIIFDLYTLEEYKNANNFTKSKAISLYRENFGRTPENSVYNVLTKYDKINSNIKSALSLQLYKTLEKNFYDVIKGKVSIPSFTKNNMVIPFSLLVGGESNIYQHAEGYRVLFPLSRSERSRLGEIALQLFFGNDQSNNRIIVEKAIAGEYKLCDSKIQIKDGDIFLLLTVKIPDKISSPNPDLTMGVDLGINRPATIYINGIKYQPQQIQYAEKFQHERMQIVAIRKGLQQSLKFGKSGRGRKNTMASLDRLREREKNWATLTNHKLSDAIIDIANKYSVSTINLEDLTGITAHTKRQFLKSWSYYQLGEFIKYKAEMSGMKLKYVNPHNTSLTCPTCNIANVENRSKTERTKFKCTNIECDDFDKLKDADIVAAMNISRLSGEEFKPKSKKARMEKAKAKKLQPQS